MGKNRLEKLLSEYVSELLRSKNKKNAIEDLLDRIKKNSELKSALEDILKNISYDLIHNDIPPISTDRKILEDKLIHNLILRKELVPCKSKRCRKNPDIHGPYWYSYRLIKGKWIVCYHGENEPNLKPEFNYNRALTTITKFSKQRSLSGDDIDTLQRVISSFSYDGSIRASEIIKKSIILIHNEEKRRERVIRYLHDGLMSKVESGKKLTKIESKYLHKTTELLTAAH